MDMADIRRRNLQLLVDKYESQQEVADIVKISPQYLSQLLSGHRNIGEKTARKIEAAVKIPRLTLDIEPGMSESSMFLMARRYGAWCRWSRGSAPGATPAIREAATRFARDLIDLAEDEVLRRSRHTTGEG